MRRTGSGNPTESGPSECRLPESGLSVEWSRIFHPEWDNQPEQYVTDGLVEWGRSRRLAKAWDPRLGFKSYLGVQHFDPARWQLSGEPTTTFFASFLIQGRSAELRTFPSMSEALAAVRRFHARLAEGDQGSGPV